MNNNFRVGNSIKLPTLFCLLLVFSLPSSGISPSLAFQYQTTHWPERVAASYGFEVMYDHNKLIIVSSVDTTTQAYKLGVRPGMELLAWNTLPVSRKLNSMKVSKYRKSFPLITDEQIKLILITRGRQGETAEAFFMTPTGNNRGIRLIAK